MMLLAYLLTFCAAPIGELPEPSAPPVVSIPATLRDQYDAPLDLSFPRTNVTILVIADRTGSRQVQGWIAELKPWFAERIEFWGLANVRGVPGPLRNRIRMKFQENCEYRVLLDWTGEVCARLKYRPGRANLLVLARNGQVCARFEGEVNVQALARARDAIQKALGTANADDRGRAQTPVEESSR